MKKLSNTTKVLSYIQKHPNAKASEVAKAVGVSVSAVYQITHNTRKRLLNSDPPKRGRPNKIVMSYEAPLTEVRDGQVRLVKELTDSVNHPPHYKVGGIETIDFIEAKSLSYNLGNVVKYITRADHKGNKLEDLKKAQWYLNREVQTMEKSK